jgi:hypothetical protein
LVCRPKKFGGLEDLNLELQNKALLLKKLHKLYTKADIPWVKLVWDLYGDHNVFLMLNPREDYFGGGIFSNW